MANQFGRYDLLHIDSVDSSELVDAQSLSQFLQVPLKTEKLDYESFCELLDDSLSHWEYPLVHPNATGILCFRLARESGYKVLLARRCGRVVRRLPPLQAIWLFSIDQ